jgi:hypothetical protein
MNVMQSEKLRSASVSDLQRKETGPIVIDQVKPTMDEINKARAEEFQRLRGLRMAETPTQNGAKA